MQKIMTGIDKTWEQRSYFPKIDRTLIKVAEIKRKILIFF